MIQQRSLLWSAALATLLLQSPSQALVGPSRTVAGRPLHQSPSKTIVGVSATVSDASAAAEATSKGDDDKEDAAASPNVASAASSTAGEQLTHALISGLRFRELKRELQTRGLAEDGTTSQLRGRLRAAVFPDDVCVVREDGEEECGPYFGVNSFVDFKDESNPMENLISEIEAKCEQGHWKAATRKMKKLSRQFPDEYIPEEVYLKVLDSCMENRLQGARASEPARKLMEQLVEKGYYIPDKEGNFCIQNCLGFTDQFSTHQGFGGIDTALAMVAAMEKSGTPIQGETFEKLSIALSKEGSIDEALAMLRNLVVEQSETPSLATFASVARNALMADSEPAHAEKVLSVLAYLKASGYELDTIASTEDGRDILAQGVIAADRLKNDALGFRFLKAAQSVKGVAPDRGDTMVALSSSAAQRACTLIHKRAINKAVQDGEWQLAVRVLELMLKRSLKPSPWIWRNVVACCAKAEKSRKATGLLLDWVKLYERGDAEKPPLSTFNVCINACEICGEQELTLVVLDAMKKTHETEGNLITFNIALKRLAKLGNFVACEGIIVGMLKAGVEPSVVSYTTAIASCASSKVKQPKTAYEWLLRMRSRKVEPNVVTYNTALSACADGTLEGIFLASKIAKEMLADVDKQLQEADESNELDEYRNVIPDASTKEVARRLMQQLKQNWIDGNIDKRVATETVRVPFLQLVDFQKSEAAEKARQQAADRRTAQEEEQVQSKRAEIDLEILSHRVAEV